MAKEYTPGKLVIEGKTKQVFDVVNNPNYAILKSKDRITAGDGAKAHDLAGKAEVSTSTTCKVFQLLNTFGIKTAYVKQLDSVSMLAKKCEMIPIEWVTRRVATGSYIRRFPGVQDGHKFTPPLQETFFKDDANHDPFWPHHQIVSANFKFNGLTIGKGEVEIMKRTSITIFEVLEKAWATRDCTLIDMKIEFGVDQNGEIVLADVIDSDSWRLWPSGDRRLMKDKQVYRNLNNVTADDLATVIKNFRWISDQLDLIVAGTPSKVVIVMASPGDADHTNAIAKHCSALGLQAEIRVSSAHKTTTDTLDIVAEYEGSSEPVVFIAVAGRSNGLGPVIAGNTVMPVINCPPLSSGEASHDIWSSLNTPSGLGCTTVRYPEAAAQAAASIHALSNHAIWSRLRVKQLSNFIKLKQVDKESRNQS
nr:PREDICTED: multifunctional protein ADE2-like [Bemisia tabaci]